MFAPPLPPREAWQPLPASAWNADLARHLLRRAGWAARPDEVHRAVNEGLRPTLDRLFPEKAPALPRPVFLARATERITELQPLKRAAATPDDRRVLDREERDLERGAANELALKWLQAAADPSRSAFEKWLLFLADIYVVSFEKTRRAENVYRHWDALRHGALGPAPALAKAVSRSPAMIDYLDLNRSSRRAPNENFARELFELFVLGEGNYTEDDIKQAARAFTGYRYNRDGFRFSPRDHDDGEKTVFGQTGKFTGDDVVDLAFAQAAGATFLPREMARFYLTEQTLPHEFFAPLGEAWRASGLDLRDLCHRFFGSLVFYHPQFRASYIKSPLHYYLGLVQDLGLDVIPLERMTLQPLRQMGQQLFYPPNVRGWVGGRLWINSSTLAARRQLAQTLGSPFDEQRLNGDEALEIEVARDAGRRRFTVDEERIRAFTALGPQGVADRLCDYFLPGRVDDGYRSALVGYLDAATGASAFEDRARRAAITVLQSPEYQLC
jgi:uncharacterized protein (DUF1800 family)